MASIPAPPPVTLPGPISWWHKPKVRRRVIAVAVLAGVYVLGLSYGAWTRVCAGEHCPSISRLVANPNHQVQTSKVYAADGRLISELGAERRTVLPLTDIPLPVRQAFIATEDKRFYEHHGIDYWRIVGAIKNDVLTMSFAQGFSTITMQLARNIFPEEISREKTLTRKLKEARVAVEIESNFPKDTILQLYLNQINLGAGAHGVEAAAQIYFGKHAQQLNVAEAATLAALPKLPAFYNPRTHPERAVRRRNVVLGLMRDQGFLTSEEAELWQAYPLVLTGKRTNYGDVAPYFVEWLRVQLDARFGRDLYEGGLRIYTTLDLDMQEAAERAVQSQLDAIEAGVYSNGKFPGRTTYREYLESSRASGEDHGPFTPYLQGALVALEANTGYIRALIGGRDFADSKYHHAAAAISLDPHRRQGRAPDRDDRGLYRVRHARHPRGAGRRAARGRPAGQHPVAARDPPRARDGSRAHVAHGGHDEGRDPPRHGVQRRLESGVHASPGGREDRDDRRLHRRLVHRVYARARDGHLGRLRHPAAHPRAQRGWRKNRRARLDRVHARCVRPPARTARLGATRLAHHARSGLVERLPRHAVLPPGSAALGLVLPGHRADSGLSGARPVRARGVTLGTRGSGLGARECAGSPRAPNP